MLNQIKDFLKNAEEINKRRVLVQMKIKLRVKRRRVERSGTLNRRHYSNKGKVKTLREHLENQVPLSDLAERYGIHISDLYNWKKKLFEGAVELFSTKHKGKASARKNEKLKKKDRLIFELVEENISLKKNLTGKI